MRRSRSLIAALGTAALVAACGGQADGPSLEEKKALVQQFFRAIDESRGAPEFIDEWITPDFRTYFNSQEAMDLAGYRGFMSEALAAFSDMRHEIRYMIAEDDRVAAGITLSMTHTGDYAGVPATGAKVSVEEIVVLRLRDRKIAEEWVLFDFAALQGQLEAAAPLASGLAQQPGARDAAVQEAGPTLSPAAQAVWEMEEAYWRYVEAGDVDNYLGLWHDDFVGWPCFSWSPGGKADVGAWVESIRDNGWRLTYRLRPQAVRLFGDVAVAHYAAEYVYEYGDGTTEGAGEWRKFTHTWMKVDDRWQIIGGMCADQAPVGRSRR